MSSEASNAAPRHEDLVCERLVRWYFYAALSYLFLSMLGGLLMASQLIHWNPLNGIEFLSPGRWRMIHTNAVAYGFLANSFLGMLHWVVPRLTLHAHGQSSAVVFHLRGLAGRGRFHGAGNYRRADLSGQRVGREGFGFVAPGVLLALGSRPGMGRDAVLDRSGRLAGIGLGRRQLPGADRQGEGAVVRHACGTSWRPSCGRF